LLKDTNLIIIINGKILEGVGEHSRKQTSHAIQKLRKCPNTKIGRNLCCTFFDSPTLDHFISLAR
jgi:hypothetical protein